MAQNAFTNKVKQVWAFIKRIALRVWAYLKVAKMEWIVMISVFALDLVAKSIVENCLEFNESVPMIPYVFNAHKVHNYSAAFGASFLRSWFGDIGARIFFCVFAVAASVAFALILIRHKGKSKWFRVALALFIAGAMGNCIDRMALGYVRDFIEFVYLGMTIGGSKTWPYVFNIADVALVAGVIMIVIYFLFIYRDPDKKKAVKLNITLDDDRGGIMDGNAATTPAAADNESEATDTAEISESAENNGNGEVACETSTADGEDKDIINGNGGNDENGGGDTEA